MPLPIASRARSHAHRSLRFVFALVSLAFAGCSDPDPDEDCGCRGEVPGGELDLACGESVCLSGGDGAFGYICTDRDTATVTATACMGSADASPPELDAGPGGRDGGERLDASPPRTDARPPSPDAGGDIGCGVRFRYPDADGDGFGATELAQEVCPSESGFVDMAGDCDDTDRSVHPRGDELCDGVDSNCDGEVDPPACLIYVGSYTGSYELRAEERLGATVINAVHCLGGTHAITVDLAAEHPLSGTATCHYSGSIGDFASDPTATLTATLDATGAVRGRLVHDFGPERGSFSFEGTLSPAGLTIEGTGGFRPHPMSAVPWDVTFHLAPPSR